MTPFQINRDLGHIIGRKPAGPTETVVNFDLDENGGTLSVLIEKRRVEKRGRREIITRTRVLRVWTCMGGTWALTDSVTGPDSEPETVMKFESPTADEQRERALSVRLGRPYDRDGYRTPVSA